MQELYAAIGWMVVAIIGLAIVVGLPFAAIEYFRAQRRRLRILGTKLPLIDERLDVNKRYDLFSYDWKNQEQVKLSAARIIGFEQREREEYFDGIWLVVELPDGRRAYLRPYSIRLFVEAPPAAAPAP
jgi:hypothetical protein